MVPEGSPKQYHGWAEASQSIRSVAVDQQGPGQPVSVQLPSGTQVVHAQPLGRLDSNLTPFISPGIVGGADSVADTPPGEEVLAGCGGEH